MQQYKTSGTCRNIYLNSKGQIVKKPRGKYDCYIEENLNEIACWEYYKDKPEGKYLLPILAHSKTGLSITFPFCADCTLEDLRTSDLKIPKTWNDLLIRNLGIYQGRVVIRDYGTIEQRKQRWVYVKNLDDLDSLMY